MRILIAGIHGTVGGLIARHFAAAGHSVTGISRKPGKPGANESCGLPVATRLVAWSALTPELFADLQPEVVCNCAGAPMLQRWTRRKRQQIQDSRLATTRRLYELSATLPKRRRPDCIVNMSSVAIYGNRPTAVDESVIPAALDNFFQAQVWQAVEQQVHECTTPGIRNVVARLGVVISPHAMLLGMLNAARFGLSCVLGDGRQQLSWISGQDLARAIEHLVVNTHLHGVFNIVSPQVTSSRQLSTVAAECMGRKPTLRIPLPLLRALLGSVAETFGISAPVKPVRLRESCFDWLQPDLRAAVSAAAAELGLAAAASAETGRRPRRDALLAAGHPGRAR